MSDKGAGPLVYEAPVLVIAGRDYKLRRLGILDVQRAAKIVATVVESGGRHAIANMGSISEDEIGTYIIDLLPLALDEVIDWIADYLGIARGAHENVADDPRWYESEGIKGTIRDPEVFPLGSEMAVVEALMNHEDIQAFFGSVGRVMKHPALQKLTQKKPLNKRSTASKKDTAGRTSKS